MPLAGASFTTHNKKIFDKLHLFIEQKADEVAHARVENMKNALIFRRNLEGETAARYPRSAEGAKAKERTDGHSFQAWQMRKKGTAHYTLFNNHANSVDDFPYPRLVAYGTNSPNVWTRSIMNGTEKNLVVTNGRVFTKSLPQGLTPYFRRQKLILKKELNQIIDDWNKK